MNKETFYFALILSAFSLPASGSKALRYAEYSCNQMKNEKACVLLEKLKNKEQQKSEQAEKSKENQENE